MKSHLSLPAAFLLLVTPIPLGAVDTTGSSQSSDRRPTLPAGRPADQVAAVIKQHEEALSAYSKLRKTVKTKEDEERLVGHFPDPTPYADLLIQVAEANPEDSAALDALLWVFRNRSGMPSRLEMPFARAKKLLRLHVKNPRIGPLCLALRQEILDNEIVDINRRVLAENPSKEARAQAAFGLANLFRERAGFARTVNKATPERIASLEKLFGKHKLAQVGRWEGRALEGEEQECLEMIKNNKEYSNVEIPFGESPARLGDLADRQLFEVRYLRPGKTAPEISGDDIDGKPMKLSDLRGKVVLLDFCGHWCGPCREIYVRGRSLVKKYEGRPFAIVGVNSDSSREKVKEISTKEKITWRSFWDGGSVDGPIQRKWNVMQWPTIYVIDHKGVVVGRLDIDEAEEIIEGKVEEAMIALKKNSR